MARRSSEKPTSRDEECTNCTAVVLVLAPWWGAAWAEQWPTTSVRGHSALALGSPSRTPRRPVATALLEEIAHGAPCVSEASQ